MKTTKGLKINTVYFTALSTVWNFKTMTITIQILMHSIRSKAMKYLLCFLITKTSSYDVILIEALAFIITPYFF